MLSRLDRDPTALVVVGVFNAVVLVNEDAWRRR
jgi:hypothetical protein